MNKFKGGKVILIGNGAVGSSYAFLLVNQGTVDELAIIDLDTEEVRGDVMDSKHATSYSLTIVRVKTGEYSDCHDADLAVICTGAVQKPGGTHLDLVPKDLKIFKPIAGEAVVSKSDGIPSVTTDLVDILAYVTQGFSDLPKERVIGSGTILDSARFRLLLSEVFDVAPRSADVQVTGKYGDTELPIWLHANIAGQPLRTLPEQHLEGKTQVEQILIRARGAAYNIIQARGATYHGVVMGLAGTTEATFKNEDAVLAVSILLEDEHEGEDVYIGVSVIINRNGIHNVVEIPLDDRKRSKFVYLARTLKDTMAEAEELK